MITQIDTPEESVKVQQLKRDSNNEKLIINPNVNNENMILNEKNSVCVCVCVFKKLNKIH